MKRTREAWLQQAIKILKEGVFKRHRVPKVKVSVGFPQGGRGGKRIGEHWVPEASDDKVGSIFISPILDDAVRVLDVLVHELVHASVGNKAGHGPKFKKVALAVGLAGQMRSTEAGPELKVKLQDVLKDLGAYPHAKLNLTKGPTKKQSTRMVKMECMECGYIVRGALTKILLNGPVICPCNREPMQVHIPGDAL